MMSIPLAWLGVGLVSTAALYFVRRRNWRPPLTWGDLFSVLTGICMGPITGIVMCLAVAAHVIDIACRYWDRPVFRKRKST